MHLALTLLLALPAHAEPDFPKAFADRDACFLVQELDSGKTVIEHNPKRCKERFTPCSSFKIAAALMAFEKGILQDENQIIPWDGVKRGRAEENKNQTPLTWMSDSVKWVTE